MTRSWCGWRHPPTSSTASTCRPQSSSLRFGAVDAGGHSDETGIGPARRVVLRNDGLMTKTALEKQFHDKVSEKIRLASEGVDRFRVFTPFLLEDGDHLAIVLKKERSQWVLSDDAHTYMHLTYDIDERDLSSGSRQRIVSNTLSTFGIDDRDGELVLEIPDQRYGDALYSFIQALMKIADVSYLSRERARSTFMEDFRSLLSNTVPEERRSFDWNDPERDPQGMYTVDCRVNHMDRPLFVHALANDEGRETPP